MTSRKRFVLVLGVLLMLLAVGLPGVALADEPVVPEQTPPGSSGGNPGWGDEPVPPVQTPPGSDGIQVGESDLPSPRQSISCWYYIFDPWAFHGYAYGGAETEAACAGCYWGLNVSVKAWLWWWDWDDMEWDQVAYASQSGVSPPLSSVYVYPRATGVTGPYVVTSQHRVWYMGNLVCAENMESNIEDLTF